MKEINMDIPPANHINLQTHINANNEKDSIIDNYLPNLSNYQKVTKKIEENNMEFVLSPNVNFTRQKDYYIFYNDNLKILIDMHKEKLKQLQLKHYVILYFKKENLNDCLKQISYDPSPDYDGGLFKSISQLLAGKFYQDIIDQVNLIAINLSILNGAVDEFTEKITSERMCVITISENIFDEKIKIKRFFKSKEHNFYLEFLDKIEEIKKKKLDDIEKLKLIDEKINEYKKEIIPENSIDNMIDFSFVLNIISEYLSNYERSLEAKSLDLLKIMDSIRRKLDSYLLEFRYKFVENGSPILKIKIDRYKILCECKEKTAIYLEKGEAKKFMKNLEENFDIKAKNIDANYQFQDIEFETIVKIAKEINFKTYEDLSEALETKIRDYQSKYNSKQIELTSYTAKTAIKIVLTGLNLMIKGKEKSISSEQIEKFIESDNEKKEEKEENKIEEEKEENTIEEEKEEKKNRRKKR